MVGLRDRRTAAFESFDFERGRADLMRRRGANLERIPELLDQFRTRLEGAGGVFHLAHDADEATSIIGQICQAAGAGIVTKSKSMTSEEIELNRHLESLGMDVVETDLGEYIVQRRHERPSHMIAPAVHLTLQDWASELGSDADRDAIMATVRERLREKFIAAAVGISGANAAIAETGTVMIVTNEGNADLTVTLPRVHIALFGLDKLVASLDDAVAILRMLPRSATGQVMTSYVNWITGPSRSSDIGFVPVTGAHGPKEMHCVVLDNGRSKMLESPIFAEAMTCIRCGACSNACPSFMAVGGHQFGHIYTGPIGLVVSPFHHGKESIDLPQSLCTQCNACEEVCPVGIPLPSQILEHRQRASKTVRKRVLLDLWSRPELAKRALNLASPISNLLSMGPLPLAARTFQRDFRPGGEGSPLTLFSSCMGDRVTPEASHALVKIARAAGYRVEASGAQWCCGLISANAGDPEHGARLARELVQVLAASSGPILTPSASCYGALCTDSVSWGSASEQHSIVVARLRDSTRWLLELLTTRPQLIDPDRPRERVAYHDSCQSLRQLGLEEEPRQVLVLAGYEVVELPHTANCCGFGGTFSLDWPQVAARMGEWKMQDLASTQASILTSDNPGCIAQLRSAAGRAKGKVRVAHLAELVADHLVVA